MNNILQRIQDAVSRGEIQNPLVLELCDEIGKTVNEDPCYLGDILYRPFNGEIQALSVDNVIHKQMGADIVFCMGGARFWTDQIGKTAFLTRPEAEAALEGSKRHDRD